MAIDLRAAGAMAGIGSGFNEAVTGAFNVFDSLRQRRIQTGERMEKFANQQVRDAIASNSPSAALDATNKVTEALNEQMLGVSGPRLGALPQAPTMLPGENADSQTYKDRVAEYEKASKTYLDKAGYYAGMTDTKVEKDLKNRSLTQMIGPSGQIKSETERMYGLDPEKAADIAWQKERGGIEHGYKMEEIAATGQNQLAVAGVRADGTGSGSDGKEAKKFAGDYADNRMTAYQTAMAKLSADPASTPAQYFSLARQFGVSHLSNPRDMSQAAAVFAQQGLEQAARIYGGQQPQMSGNSTAAATGAPAQMVPMIDVAHQITGVPPQLLAGLLKFESGFNPKAVSPAGALGVAQFMPGTAADIKLPWKKDKGIDPLNPAEAIPGAAIYLKQGFDQAKANGVKDDGDAWKMAAAGYQSGHGTIKAAIQAAGPTWAGVSRWLKAKGIGDGITATADYGDKVGGGAGIQPAAVQQPKRDPALQSLLDKGKQRDALRQKTAGDKRAKMGGTLTSMMGRDTRTAD